MTPRIFFRNGAFYPYCISQMSGPITASGGIIGVDFNRDASSTNSTAMNHLQPDGLTFGAPGHVRFGPRVSRASDQSFAFQTLAGSPIADVTVSGELSLSVSAGQLLESGDGALATGTYIKTILQDSRVVLSEPALLSGTHAIIVKAKSFLTEQSFKFLNMLVDGTLYMGALTVSIDELKGASVLNLQSGTGGAVAKIGAAGDFHSKVRVFGDVNLSLSDQREIPSEPATNAAFHVDASALSTMITSVSGKDVLVTKWSDKNGRMVDPTLELFAVSNTRNATPPILVTNALNGLPVVDFGLIGSGEHLCWDTNINVRSLFLVMKVKSAATTPLGSYLPMLAKGNFSRVASNGMIWSPTVGDLSVRQGLTYLHGVACDPAQTPLPNNQFVLLSERLQGSALACAFGGEAYDYSRVPLLRKERTGGLQLAEVVIYDRRVSDQERRDLEAYLSWKWFGEVLPGYASESGRKLAKKISAVIPSQLNLIGEGPVFVDELNSSSVLAISNESVFSAASFSGSGDLCKQGRGTLDLSGAALASGRFTVEQGQLAINGVVALLDVAPSAVVDLGGGSLEAKILTGAGTLAQGSVSTSYLRTHASESTLGTLRLGGSFTLSKEAVYQVGVNSDLSCSCVDVSGELIFRTIVRFIFALYARVLPWLVPTMNED
ncbi:MAG: hypothetical protein PHO37_07055 [Kiritimatiellae bacterium]|nr:hypothetical protein [Kiritimatiellia bacterium]